MNKRSKSAPGIRGAGIRGAAEAVLGTDLKGQNSVYDTRSGTLLTIVLLFVLGWIPMIGQMVTGFVGGRRSGSPMRGFVATLTGTVTVVLIMYFTVEGLRMIDPVLIENPESEIAILSVSYPYLEEFLNLALMYTRDLYGSADFTINYSAFALTIPFGIIGGIFANQAQKETRLIVARTAKATARRIRSIDAYKDGKSLGFETYEQYMAMSVNTTSAPVPKVSKKTKATVSKKRTKDPQVTATVDATKIQASTTSSTSGSRKKKDSGGDSTLYI